ncbi:MAG: response regulator receiver protein [Ferruginibacter sp.]|nr:response regulator receiver protein [Ferruginibacter sp.]
MKSGPIVIIEDDADDKSILESVLVELNVTNKLVWFNNCPDAFHYLKTTSEQPFLILSDVNLPGQKGISFKKQVDEDPELRKKSIPFVFYSTAAEQKTVNEAYTEMTVQGYFQKKSDYGEIKQDIKLIIDYWLACKHPNVK